MGTVGAFWQYGRFEDGRIFEYYREMYSSTILVKGNLTLMNPGELVRLNTEVRQVLEIEIVSNQPGVAKVLTGELLSSPTQ